MYSTNTNTCTSTYTVIDVRKTFEGCETDIRTIARRTGKWTVDYVDKVFHDVLLLAEEGYLKNVSIALIDSETDIPLRAAKFIVNSDGTVMSSDKAGRNTEWPNNFDTKLTVILTYTNNWLNLTKNEQITFRNKNNFKIGWSSSDIDNDFPNLSSSQRQLYASNGYELQKMDYQ